MIGEFAGIRVRQRPFVSGRAPFEPAPALAKRVEGWQAAFSEPFTGVTTDGRPQPGLFPMQRTGVSTLPLVEAARAYLAALDPEQRVQGQCEVDSDRWRAWSNIHAYLMRHGVCLEQMEGNQLALALDLVRAGLSASGFETARNVMKLNDFIGEITGKEEEFGEWLYWLSIFGTPSTDQPWGWQLDGHHLNVNCFILGDQVVMTPVFMGSEPVTCDVGKHAGISVFQPEQALGLSFMQSLTPAQRDRATVGMKLPAEALTAGFSDNACIPYEGLRYDDLSDVQQRRMLELVDTYISPMRTGHAQVRMNEIQQHLGDTHFAWIGDCGDDSVFYYRVHSPVVLIEFDHVPGIALENDYPSRHHIHTVVRTPNGNDYGKDLLRQHYEQYQHVGGVHVAR